jgi:hypothetical protein
MVLVVASALVVVAIVKPWGAVGPLDVSSPAPSGATWSADGRALDVRPALAPVKTPAELAAPFCHDAITWTVFSYQRRGNGTFNVWTRADVVRSGAADLAAITFTPIFAEQLTGFGYCAGDEHDDLRPRPSDPVTIWKVDPDDETVSQVPTMSIEPDLRPDFGALLAPSTSPEQPATTVPGWPPGRYLIRVGDTVLGAEVFLVRFGR